MSMSTALIHEVNDEIERAEQKWGKIDEDPHEMLNGVTKELLEVVHAVNHREGPARVHEEIIHAMGVLVRLDEMQANLAEPDKQSLKCPYCEKGDKPKLLDEDGVLCKISGKEGVWMHAFEDYWWPCLKPPSLINVPNQEPIIVDMKPRRG